MSQRLVGYGVSQVPTNGMLGGMAYQDPINVTVNNISVGSGTLTGTASQPLQVTGGAYVSGSVGIGISTPLTKLDVRGVITAGADATSGSEIIRGYYSGGGSLNVIGSEYSSGGLVLGYSVKPSTSASSAFFSSTGISVSRGAYTIAGNEHKWYAGAVQTVAENSSVTMSEVMRINASGNLGIGTITPRTKLDVAGGGYFTGFSNPTDSGRAGLEIGYDGSQGVVQCYDRPNSVFKNIQYQATQHIFSGGNIKVGSGYGIDFSANANAAGMTSELLDDYEEGTHTTTITLGSGSIVNTLSNTLSYTKIGKVVNIIGRIHVELSSTDVTSFSFTLPFTVTNSFDNDAANVMQAIRSTGGDPGAGARIFRANLGNSSMSMQNSSGGSYGNFGTITPHINVFITYHTDS